MKSSFRIHRTMVDIINALIPNNLYRRDLIRIAASLPEYSTGQKAERFISSQVFRLTKNNLLESVRDHKGLWYKPSSQLLMLLKEATTIDCVDKGINLEKEESQIQSELNLCLAELEGLRELRQKHPILKLDIEELIANEKDHVTNLNGRLNAVRKLRAFILDNRQYKERDNLSSSMV